LILLIPKIPLQARRNFVFSRSTAAPRNCWPSLKPAASLLVSIRAIPCADVTPNHLAVIEFLGYKFAGAAAMSGEV